MHQEDPLPETDVIPEEQRSQCMCCSSTKSASTITGKRALPIRTVTNFPIPRHHPWLPGYFAHFTYSLRGHQRLEFG